MFFPLTKTMEIIKTHFGHRVENTAPVTELHRIFYAGISQLQLGVVFVLQLIITHRFFSLRDMASIPQDGSLSGLGGYRWSNFHTDHWYKRYNS